MLWLPSCVLQEATFTADANFGVNHLFVGRGRRGFAGTDEHAYCVTAFQHSFWVGTSTDPHRGSHHEQHGFAWIADLSGDYMQSVVACGVGDVMRVVGSASSADEGCGLTLFDEWCLGCPHCVLQRATFTGEANFEVNQHWSDVVDAVSPALTNMHTA